MKKKITITSITGVVGLLILLLTLIEKTESFIARVASRDPAYEMTEYSQERPFLRGQEPSQIRATKQ
jgi:hypothetical protein